MQEVTLQTVSRLSSPALRWFETNPFRVLRLAADASASDAAFQAERVLTLMRADLPPAEEDVLPWLPPANVYEAQQAAQTVEEPLARLTEQMLWFDFARDPNADLLCSLLRGLSDEALHSYFEGEAGLPPPEGCDPEDASGVAVVTQAVNHANLRLLVAASLVNGVGITATDAPVEPRKIARVDWQNMFGLSALPNAHEVIAGPLAGGGAAADGARYWERALRRWSGILTHPWFRPYLVRCIKDLDDDFASEEDAETIEESVRTRLADLASHETRFLLLRGDYQLAGELISALARSGLEKRVLVPALRPIHHHFQSEVSELKPLLEVSGQEGLGQVGAYLKRLGAIKRRWAKLDEAGLVGLVHILDEALEEAFLRLREVEKLDPESEALLERLSALAGAASLRERVKSFRGEMEEARKRLCQFCKTEPPDYEKSVVLEGKKETGRESSYNSTTIYYSLRYEIVLRCERCARFHDFEHNFGIYMTAALLAPVAVLSIPFLLLLLFTCWGAVIAAAVVPYIVKFFLWAFSSGLALLVTPKGHRRYGDYRDTEGVQRLHAEGYFTIKPDWRSTAVSNIKTA
jgi:hypothetical protein